MFYSIIPVLLIGSAIAAPLDNTGMLGTRQSATCPTTHIIAARASTEQPGPGIIGSLATLVQQANTGTDLASVDYPATLDNYASSSSMGTAALTQMLTNFTSQCPQSKVVLLGYSQGAQVVGDTLCGGGGAPGLGAATPPIDAAISDKVTAIVQMGDPRALVGQPQDVGSATMNGIFPRQQNQLCPPSITSKTQAYCDMGDPFCASGQQIAVHLGYTQEFNTQAAAFINGKLKA